MAIPSSTCTAVLLLSFLMLIAFSLLNDIPSTTSSLLSMRFSDRSAADIAYFIQVVPSTLAHLPRLFRRVYHPANVYAIHFDVKIPPSQAASTMVTLRSLVPNLSINTHVLPPDVIVYNGVSMILNTLAAINYLLSLEHSWSFFINLSGSDYPLTNPYLPRTLLASALPYSPIFLSLAGEDAWYSRFKARAKFMVVDPSLAHALNSSYSSLVQTSYLNPIFENITFTPVHAEAWMILPRHFCMYISTSPVARRMLLTLANMRGSDEYYFSSLAYNHPVFNRSIVPHSFRKVIWTKDGVHAGQHPYYIDDIVNGKYVFRDELRNCVQWHARKFFNNDSVLMDEIDAFANDPERVAKIVKEFRRKMNRLKDRLESSSSPPLDSPLFDDFSHTAHVPKQQQQQQQQQLHRQKQQQRVVQSIRQQQNRPNFTIQS